jgi:hypothetical protein
VTLWQERKRAERAGGSVEPPIDLAAVAWECGSKDVAVLGEPSPVRSAIGDEQPAGNNLRAPPAVDRNASAESQLPIERAEEFGNVNELCLELDDEQCPRLVMPPEGVDDASLAVDGEGHLGRDLPSGDTGEPAAECLVQRSVTRTDHAIELAAAPAQRVVRPAVERLGDGSDGLHRQLIGQPALDPGHV